MSELVAAMDEVLRLLEAAYPSALTLGEIAGRRTGSRSDTAESMSALEALESGGLVVSMRTCSTGSVMWATRGASRLQ